MKNFFCFIISFLALFIVSACSSQKSSESSKTEEQNLEQQVSKELSSLSFCDNVSDETLKCLAVIIRTNIYNDNNDLNYETSEDENLVNTQNLERINNAAKSTEGLILKSNQNNNSSLTYSYNKDENFAWQTKIKKWELLSFLDKHNISLAQISDFSFENDESGRVKNIIIGGKQFDFKMLAKEFNLKSDNITNIYSSSSYIIVEGFGVGFKDSFDAFKIEKTKNSDQNFVEILKNFYPNYSINNIK